MKKKILNCAETIIRRNNPSYDNEKLEVIMYGLESLYLSITKFIVITLVSILLGIFYEYMIILIIFNVIRLSGFGMHASKSNICLYASMASFIIAPYVCSYFVLNTIIKVLIGIFCIINFMLYAPADTEKRPIVNPKRRMAYKIITTFISIIFTLIAVFINNNFLSNAFLIGMIIEVILIHPLSYKVFNMSYDNYKKLKI